MSPEIKFQESSGLYFQGHFEKIRAFFQSFNFILFSRDVVT